MTKSYMMIKEEYDLFSAMMPEDAVRRLSEYIAVHPDDDEAFLLRGMKHWAMQHRAPAINDYLSAIRINPESRARQALDNANAILNFYNKDLYNP